MSTIAQARLLVGRKIVGFELGSFPDGRGGTAHAPVITLDNGARVYFTVEETETAEGYGVWPGYARPKPGSNR